MRQEKKKDKDNISIVLSYFHDIAYLLAVILIVFLLLFRVVIVSGPSMNNTLVDGDYLLLVNSLFYQDPKQGDIIVASKQSFKNGEPIIKRVIATEGQTVNIDFDTGIVYVDGKPLTEPYTTSLTTLDEGVDFPLTVAQGCVFVMGDNRGYSQDSRSPQIGQIDRRQIMGKAVFLFLPGTNKGAQNREFNRIGVLQ